MRVLIVLPAIVLASLLVGAPAGAQGVRQEVHALQSATLSDADFLTGKRQGRRVKLSAVLRLPKGSGGKLPAVVLLHGSGGVGGRGSMIDEWSKELNRIGIATFAVNSFSARRIVETVTDQRRLGRLNMIIDAYRALELLGQHKQIDPTRIAVMGFSRGGQSALYSSLRRFYKMHGPKSGLQFAAHVGLYATCGTTFHGDDDVAKPIRLLHGTADDYVSVAPCRAYVERLSKAGRDIRLVEYPNAAHAFDAPVFRRPMKIKGAPTTARCQLAEAENGIILNRATKRPFSYSDACVGKGPTVAYNKAASDRARAYVRAFLKEVFTLK